MRRSASSCVTKEAEGRPIMAGNSHPSPVVSLKKPRTRILTSRQSRYGCFECKKRRIKCTEEKPICSRCVRSGRQCSGYPINAPGSETTQRSLLASTSSTKETGTNASAPPRTLSLNPWAEHEQRRLAQLASVALAFNPHGTQSPEVTAVFQYLLPQFLHTKPFVHAAAAAFGASYNDAIITRSHHGCIQVSSKSHVEALHLVRREVGNANEEDVAPVLIACLLLAASETLRIRGKDALSHILGAFSMLYANPQELRRSTQSPSPTKPKQSVTNETATEDEVTKLYLIHDAFRSVDIEVNTFMFGKRPYLPPIHIKSNTLTLQTVEDLVGEQSRIIHSCLHFVADVGVDRTLNVDPLTSDLAAQQNNLIACLKHWLSSYEALIRTPGSLPTSFLNHLIVLKTRSLAMLVAVSCLRSDTELVWDKHAASCREIVRCCETLFVPTEQEIMGNDPNLTPFTSSIGVIMPLYLVARKYRSSEWRRRAISLLHLAGIEGPFFGAKEAAVAEHIVSLEEDRPFKLEILPEETLDPEDIPDSRRVWGCWRVCGFEDEDVSRREVIWCCNKDLGGVESIDYASQQENEEWIQWEEGIARGVATRFGKQPDQSDEHSEVQGEDRPLLPGGDFRLEDIGAKHPQPSYWTHPLTSRRTSSPWTQMY